MKYGICAARACAQAREGGGARARMRAVCGCLGVRRFEDHLALARMYEGTNLHHLVGWPLGRPPTTAAATLALAAATLAAAALALACNAHMRRVSRGRNEAGGGAADAGRAVAAAHLRSPSIDLRCLARAAPRGGVPLAAPRGEGRRHVDSRRVHVAEVNGPRLRVVAAERCAASAPADARAARSRRAARTDTMQRMGGAPVMVMNQQVAGAWLAAPLAPPPACVRATPAQRAWPGPGGGGRRGRGRAARTGSSGGRPPHARRSSARLAARRS